MIDKLKDYTKLVDDLYQIGVSAMLQNSYGEVIYYPEESVDMNECKRDCKLSIAIGFVNDKGEKNYQSPDVRYVGREFKLPKTKKIGIDWVLEKLNKDSVYKNFAKNFAIVLKKLGIDNNSISIYPTSYGIGVFKLFSTKFTKGEIQKIKFVLDKYGIDYKNEHSEAGWVLRFKISKKRDNIEKLNKLI